jgi:hypothetical protein
MKKCDVCKRQITSHCKKSARYKMFHRASKIWTDTEHIWNFGLKTGMKLKDENIQAR